MYLIDLGEVVIPGRMIPVYSKLSPVPNLPRMNFVYPKLSRTLFTWMNSVYPELSFIL